MVIASGLALGAAEPAAELEYQVKAAYIYNFFKFVEWPQGSEAPGAPVQVCVAGQDPFGSALDQSLAQKTIGGRPVRIVRLTDADQAEGCHVAFFGAMPRKVLQQALKCLEHAAVLSVGESDEFLSSGGIIVFRVRDGKVRFVINPEAGRRAGLHISSQLLELGRAERR